MKLRLWCLDEMRRVYFTCVSGHMNMIVSLGPQTLPQLVTGHMNMTVSLGPQGTLVVGTRTEPVTVNQYGRRVQ
jgi:hypothetical protein